MVWFAWRKEVRRLVKRRGGVGLERAMAGSGAVTVGARCGCEMVGIGFDKDDKDDKDEAKNKARENLGANWKEGKLVGRGSLEFASSISARQHHRIIQAPNSYAYAYSCTGRKALSFERCCGGG